MPVWNRETDIWTVDVGCAAPGHGRSIGLLDLLGFVSSRMGNAIGERTGCGKISVARITLATRKSAEFCNCMLEAEMSYGMRSNKRSRLATCNLLLNALHQIPWLIHI